MAIRFTIKAGSGIGAPSAANTVLKAGICTADMSPIYAQTDPGQDPTAALGFGPLVECSELASLFGGSQQIDLKVPASTPGAIHGVTKSPSGDGTPTITVTGSDFDGVTDSPFGAYALRVRVNQGGAPGAATVDISLDGATYPYTVATPPERPATIRGTADLTDFDWTSIDSETIIATPDAGSQATVTLPSSVTGEDTVRTAFASHPTLGVAFVQVGDHRYIEISGVTKGSAGGLVMGNGTANSALGLTNTASATGTPSTVAIPGTGLTIAFPAGAYVAGTVEACDTTEPRFSLSDLNSALETWNESDLAAGLLEVCQEPLDGTDLRSWAASLDSTIAGWEAQSDKRFLHWILGAPLSSGQSEVDQSTKDGMSGHVSRYGTIAAGDCYVTSSSPMPNGSFRRSPRMPLAVRCAAQSLSEDPGNATFGPLDAVSMKAPDGSTKARNENTASVKLGTSTGPGFTVLESVKGQPYFVRGVTRAGAGNVFVDLGVNRMGSYAAAILFDLLRTIKNLTFDLNPDGTMQELDAANLETMFTKVLVDKLVTQKHASSASTTITRGENLAQTRNVTLNWAVQPRGQGENLTGTLTLAGVVSFGNAAAA